MKRDIISMYINLILNPIESIIRHNKIKNKDEKDKLNSLYLKILLEIEDEIKFCSKKEANQSRLAFSECHVNI